VVLNHGAKNSTMEPAMRDNHGEGGEFGRKVTKDMVKRMRHFGEQASPSPRQVGVAPRILLAD